VTPQPVRRRTLSVNELSRVEGQGGLRVVVRDGNVKDVQFRVYEPPRLFEALLVGRSFTEPPDLTARICGICPVAYQMSACRAIEDACGVVVDPPLERLRRLLYCGEWIQSHVLHISMLHAPDFLGYPGMLLAILRKAGAWVAITTPALRSAAAVNQSATESAAAGCRWASGSSTR